MGKSYRVSQGSYFSIQSSPIYVIMKKMGLESRTAEEELEISPVNSGPFYWRQKRKNTDLLSQTLA